MGELVVVERAQDLQPWDLIAEGRTIMHIWWNMPGEIPNGICVATVYGTRNEDGSVHAHVEQISDEPFPEFPITVVRPAPIPVRGG